MWLPFDSSSDSIAGDDDLSTPVLLVFAAENKNFREFGVPENPLSSVELLLLLLLLIPFSVPFVEEDECRSL